MNNSFILTIFAQFAMSDKHQLISLLLYYLKDELCQCTEKEMNAKEILTVIDYNLAQLSFAEISARGCLNMQWLKEIAECEIKVHIERSDIKVKCTELGFACEILRETIAHLEHIADRIKPRSLLRIPINEHILLIKLIHEFSLENASACKKEEFALEQEVDRLYCSDPKSGVFIVQARWGRRDMLFDAQCKYRREWTEWKCLVGALSGIATYLGDQW